MSGWSTSAPRLLGAVLLAAMLTAAGCTAAKPPARPVHTIAPGRFTPGVLGRCDSTPLPERPRHPSSGTLILPTDPGGTIAGDPIAASDRARAAADGAVVQVLVPDTTDQSGFLTTNGAGQPVAVTAAHGLINAAGDLPRPDQINVEDPIGRVSKVTAGCVVYESYGRFDNGHPGPDDVIEDDVAVLVLRWRIGSTTLPVTAAPTMRGTWYTASTLHPPATQPDGLTKPEHYDAIALGDDHTGREGRWLLSGLQPTRAAAGLRDYAAPGDSGAPLLTIPTIPGERPQVIGIITGGMAQHPLDPALLRHLFGVADVGPAAKPKAAIMTPGAVIVAAIAMTNPPTAG